MIWVLYDVDPKRARDLSVILRTRCGVQALPYEDASDLLSEQKFATTILVHCDAVRSEFDRIAGILKSGRHTLRFYCTDLRDRMSQVAFIPEDLEKLIS